MFGRRKSPRAQPDEPALKISKKEGYRTMSTYAIRDDVPRPANLPTRLTGEVKYPFREMKKGNFFEVPKEDYLPEGEEFSMEKYNAKKFRERVNQSARNAALKMNKEAQEQEGFDPEKYEVVRFTVAILENNNIGVWRD